MDTTTDNNKFDGIRLPFAGFCFLSGLEIDACPTPIRCYHRADTIWHVENYLLSQQPREDRGRSNE